MTVHHTSKDIFQSL